jgi:UDP-3-O-[3-hydroxymyristoyl] glucosamine N-acyltransferase
MLLILNQGRTKRVKTGELAELVHGKLVGAADVEIKAARGFDEAGPGDITFIADEKHAKQLHASKASAIVGPPGLPVNGQVLIEVSDPLLAFVEIVQKLDGRSKPRPSGIDPGAKVHASARVGSEPSVHALAAIGANTVIGARCRIHSGAVIGEHCRLGDDVTIYPNAVLYDDTVIGSRVIVHANAVIGADGFGYRLRDGKHVKIPQLGHVEIEDDVEIGACSTIDRATFGTTRIGAGTKIDNLVMVGHNCRIGRHNLLISQMGIAGSSSTGDYVVAAGQAGIVGHVRIGDRAVICAQAGVTKDVAADTQVLGSPAAPVREKKRVLMSLEKLPELRRDMHRIKQRLGLDNEERE